MGEWKELSELQIDEKLTLRLNCSYLAFVEWLKKYPEKTGAAGQPIRLKFTELGLLNILWVQTITQPGDTPLDMPLFDQFTFKVVQGSPLVLDGYYSYLDLIKPRPNVYSVQAQEFLELAKRYFEIEEITENSIKLQNRRRERILQYPDMIASGQTQEQIAEIFGISDRQVKSDYQKLREMKKIP